MVRIGLYDLTPVITFNCSILLTQNKKPAQPGRLFYGGRDGTRTHNRLSGTDFKSVV